MSTYSPTLNIRLRATGELFPERFTNSWGTQINDELRVIDAVISQVCTPEQIEQIRAELEKYKAAKARCGVPEGMIL